MAYRCIKIPISGDVIRNTALARTHYYYTVRTTNFYYTFLKELQGLDIQSSEVDIIEDVTDPLYFLIQSLIYELRGLKIGNVQMNEYGRDYLLKVLVIC